MCLLDTHKV